jgi:CBS domain-containing protein
MREHQIKRLPVIENKRLVGMISEADLAHHLTDDKLADFVESVYSRS